MVLFPLHHIRRYFNPEQFSPCSETRILKVFRGESLVQEPQAPEAGGLVRAAQSSSIRARATLETIPENKSKRQNFLEI